MHISFLSLKIVPATRDVFLSPSLPLSPSRWFSKMKAVTPVHPQDSSSGGSPLSLHYLSKQSLNIARCRVEDEDLFCLQYDMNDCYSRLKRLVPTIPQDKKVSKVEILQHVIDYILDLQLALETHPSLHKQQPQRTGTCPPPASNPSRTPLTALNVDHHQRTSIVNKPEDSILCR
ncbi:DNA-binding protein inhibitor ID-4 [Anarhichas minor]|uniref:DNA-binding protein inhibitor ID-4 n=1 Tax=Anarhichas minor TaxID=65739 RepID=UPI003F740037